MDSAVRVPEKNACHFVVAFSRTESGTQVHRTLCKHEREFGRIQKLTWA